MRGGLNPIRAAPGDHEEGAAPDYPETAPHSYRENVFGLHRLSRVRTVSSVDRHS
jgi:hypothetical protein